MRGQSAVEYLLIFSTALMLFAAVTIFQIITPATNAANDTLNLSQARSAVDTIGGAIDTVYADGPGAVMGVSLQMDTGWSLYLDNADNKIKISVGTSDGAENVGENLRYEIDNYHSLTNISHGLYTVIVKWSDNVSVHENINSNSLDNKKIYIYIVPRGW